MARPANRNERLVRWREFLASLPEDERPAYEMLPDQLREAYRQRCVARGISSPFGVDSSVELLIALVDWTHLYQRTCKVRLRGKR